MITTYTLVEARYPDDIDEECTDNDFVDVVLSKKDLVELITKKVIDDGFVSVWTNPSNNDFHLSSLLSYHYNRSEPGLVHLDVYIRTFYDDMEPVTEGSHRLGDSFANEIYDLLRDSLDKHGIKIPKKR